MTNPPRTHDTSVPYGDQTLTGAAVDVTGWESWSYTDNGAVFYFAKGPCQACFAVVQGSTTNVAQPVEGQGFDATPTAGAPDPKAPIEIPVTCACGYEHGKSGATGCGRNWSIVTTPTS